MNKEQADEVLMKLWLEKANDALGSAKLELAENHLSFSVNRLYYLLFLCGNGASAQKRQTVCKTFCSYV